MRAVMCAGLAITCLLAASAPAAAAPPGNDARSAPVVVTPPASVSGSTVGSTLELDEPMSCYQLRGSVFYEFRATSADRIVTRVQAFGDLDVTVEVFLRTRSQVAPLGCQGTDANGRAALNVMPEPGQTYLIRIGQRFNSVPGVFRLDVYAPEPPPRGPGPALPADGGQGTLDALEHTREAFSYRMQAGTPYRLNVAAEHCVTLRVYAPGTRDFDRSIPVAATSCDGYLLFAPRAGEGGRYSLVVQSEPNVEGQQRYRLGAAPAAEDDVAPGVPLANLTRVRGSLQGSVVDTLDLYRFSVQRRSALDLTLRYGGSGHAVLMLYDDRGRRRGAGESELARQIAPGRYFVAVRTFDGGSGGYTLRRVSRTITRTRTTIDERRSARSAPGEAVRIAAVVSPEVNGPVTFTIEHFDPLAGWLFFHQVRANASGGAASTAFTPPTEGRWRASAAFEGTRTAAPSGSGYATLLTAPDEET